jgi:hypothetical protein
LSEPKIVYETLETYQGGKSNGYYEPFKNEIHILKGKDAEFRALLHEKVHAARKEEVSFKFASLLQVPALNYMMFGLLLIFAIYALFMAKSLANTIPFLFIAGIYSFFIGCVAYEEAVADKLTLKSAKAIRQNGSDKND